MSKYYTVLTRPNKISEWEIHWGSYDKDEAVQEAIDARESYQTLQSRVIMTQPDDKAINKRVKELNNGNG